MLQFFAKTGSLAMMIVSGGRKKMRHAFFQIANFAFVDLPDIDASKV
jgi:hypothetical protein